MIMVIFTELDSNRDYKRQVGKQRQHFVVHGFTVDQAVANLMLSTEQILVESAANDVGCSGKSPPAPVANSVCHSKLSEDHANHLQGGAGNGPRGTQR